MSRELQGVVAEFRNAASDGIRQCLALADDLQEEGGTAEHKEKVKEQLLALVMLEREAGHVRTAVDHVETTVAGLQAADVPEEPPKLLEEMEDRLRELLEKGFDPCSHPSVRELTQLFSGEGNGVNDGGGEDGEDDVQVERVQQSLKCPLTGTYLEDPVSNSGCGHIYSRAAVTEHIRLRAMRAARCPVCSGPLSVECLQPETRLAKKVRRAKRKEGL